MATADCQLRLQSPGIRFDIAHRLHQCAIRIITGRPMNLRRILAAILAPTLLLAATDSASAGRRPPRTGEVAPDFELKLTNGQKVHLSELRGQVVVLNFWATWCVPCRTELPTLDAYYKIQRKHGLRVFAVTTEDSVPESQMKALFSMLTIEPIHKIKGPYAYLDGVPTNFVIDRAGIVRYARAGAFDLDQLNAVLVPLLREPAPAEAKQHGS